MKNNSEQNISEPIFTFHKDKASINTACLKAFPETDYVQILVHPARKKLAVRPCTEAEKDSLRWCRCRADKRTPKQITCRVFFAKIISLMGWNAQNRYRLSGELIRSGGEPVFVFDLNTSKMETGIRKNGEQTYERR